MGVNNPRWVVKGKKKKKEGHLHAKSTGVTENQNPPTPLERYGYLSTLEVERKLEKKPSFSRSAT